MASPNMNLTLPSVGVTIGSEWATELNNAFLTVDAHNHASGSGVQITPSGININADLPLVSNNLTQARSIRFTAQASPLALASDLACIYASGVDLYYNDGNGNQVRMTQSGNVAGSTGSISGLSSPASASYSAGTFIFQQAAATPATMDAGSVIIRNLTASAYGATVKVPNALAADYNITLPSLPASTTKILNMDTAGNMSASYVVDNSTIEISANTIQVKDAGITTAKILDSAVTTAKINAGAVTLPKLFSPTIGNPVTGAGDICQAITAPQSFGTPTTWTSVGTVGTITCTGRTLRIEVYGLGDLTSSGGGDAGFRLSVNNTLTYVNVATYNITGYQYTGLDSNPPNMVVYVAGLGSHVVTITPQSN